MAVHAAPDEVGGISAQSRRSPRTQVPPRFAVHASMKLRRFLLRAADRVLPSELAVVEHSAGFSVGYLPAALVELGVPDELAAGPWKIRSWLPSFGQLKRALRGVRPAAPVLGGDGHRRARSRISRDGLELRVLLAQQSVSAFVLRTSVDGTADAAHPHPPHA